MAYRIIKVTETPRLDQGTLTFKTDKVVQFMVDTPGPSPGFGLPAATIAHGPFQIVIPGDVFTSELAARLVAEQAAHVEKLFPGG